jgi:UDP:flavonoid glycosyltransferase YjiC (YdhE family)
LTAAQVLNEQSIPAELNPDIFAYLSNDSLSNDSIVEALGREKRKSLFISRGYKRAVPENVYHSHRIVKYSDFIYGVSVMITNANAGTVISGLLHGIPQVLIPRTVEQTLFATRVVEMGAGIMLRGVVIPSDVTAAIRVITTNPIYRDSARSFAGSYANAAVIECGHSHGVVGGIVQRIVSAGLKMKLKKE